jgi:hypothetical protein
MRFKTRPYRYQNIISNSSLFALVSVDSSFLKQCRNTIDVSSGIVIKIINVAAVSLVLPSFFSMPLSGPVALIYVKPGIRCDVSIMTNFYRNLSFLPKKPFIIALHGKFLYSDVFTHFANKSFDSNYQISTSLLFSFCYLPRYLYSIFMKYKE